MMSQDHTDPKYQGETGERLDGRNLINEQVNKHSNSLYVWKKTAFDQIDVEKTDHVMGEVSLRTLYTRKNELNHTLTPRSHSCMFNHLKIVYGGFNSLNHVQLNSTRLYRNEIPMHFTYEIETNGYIIIGVYLTLSKLMRFLRKKSSSRFLLLPNQITCTF